MPARLWNCAVLTAVVIAGVSGTLIPSPAQAKDPISTFDLDRIIELALERNPAIASARSVIEQNEGRRIEAGAYPNPTVAGQTGSGA